MNLDSCPLCQASSVRGWFVKDSIPYFKCLACDFVFSRPHENANLRNEIGDFESAYLDYLSEVPEDRINFGALVQWISRVCPLAGARVLDVGTGTGKFVQYLRERSVDAFGVEPSDALYRRFLKNESYFVNGSVEKFLAKGQIGQYDVVTTLDVLEHVERPDQFVASIAAVLRSCGWWVVSTPDVSSLVARLAGKRWHHYNKYHFSFFSPQTLSMLAAKHGFRVAALSHRGRLRSVGYILRYSTDFVMRSRQSIRPPSFLDGWVLQINILDTMYLCLQKTSPRLPCP